MISCRPFFRAVAFATMSFFVSVLAGCSWEQAGPGLGSTADPGEPIEVMPCEDGTSRTCYVTIGEHDGVLTCYEGSQSCEGGHWLECADGTLRARMATEPGGMTTKSLSQPGACVNNPCDPYCQTYDEQPDASLAADSGGPMFDWQTGSLSSFPSGLVKKGFHEPCYNAFDCQINHYCDDVATSAVCVHSKCVTGVALKETCEPGWSPGAGVTLPSCIESVCDAEPSCCASACAHEPCEIGSALAKACDPCVATVCSANAACCMSGWSAACVAQYRACHPTRCACGPGETLGPDGLSCYFVNTANKSWTDAQTTCRARGAGYDLVTIDSAEENSFISGLRGSEQIWIGLNDQGVEGAFVWSSTQQKCYENWAGGEPNNAGANEDCVQMWGGATWNDMPCTTQLDSVCEGPAAVGAEPPPLWRQSCVDKVASLCGATCGTTGAGRCTPWSPGQTDPSCSGVDLTGGIPCDQPGGTPLIPVCNRGNTEAPAGIKIVHYPAHSGHYPQCDPGKANVDYCYSTEPIQPGHCINVPCPSLSTGNTREVVINPQGFYQAPQAGDPAGTQYVAECSCQNNWTLYSKSTVCGDPSCSGGLSRATIRPLNLYIILDNSGSMAWDGRWTAAVAALKAFFQDKASAGIRVSLEMFPLPKSYPHQGCGWDCDDSPSGACADPLVALGPLTEENANKDPQEKALIDVLEDKAYTPGGGTPTQPAMIGTLNLARSNPSPDDLDVVILVTDGEPTACSTDNNVLIGLAQTAHVNDDIRTYTIGMDGANNTNLAKISAAAGGKHYIVSGNALQVAASLLAAMREISGTGATCDLELSNPGYFDPENAQVLYTSGAAVTTELPQVSGPAACGVGWYYDNNLNPTRITLCPNSCATIKADMGAMLEVNLGCPTLYAPTTVTEVYEAPCPPSTHVQWGYFTYDSVTPFDSSISFRIRTAPTTAGLASATYVNLATAQSTPADTQVCTLTGPADCPVDLWNKLGGLPKAAHNALELQVNINPTSTKLISPDLNSWDISYSCKPSE